MKGRCETGDHMVCQPGETSQGFVTHGLVVATKDMNNCGRVPEAPAAEPVNLLLFSAPSPRQNEEARAPSQMATSEAALQGALMSSP